jgi:hypothetical protein
LVSSLAQARATAHEQARDFNAGDGWGIRWRLKCLNFHGR